MRLQKSAANREGTRPGWPDPPKISLNNPVRPRIVRASSGKTPCSKTVNAMDKIPMTPTGYNALDSELKTLKTIERPAIIKAIAEAREHGDLSENAEYHSAREKQSFIEGRIKELEGLISLSQIIDPKKLSGAIKFGATVDLVDENTEEEKTYQIVGEAEARIENGLLNINSPLARALIGKEEGDSVEVKTPGGSKDYEIVKISYI